jgi:hypothetical protein
MGEVRQRPGLREEDEVRSGTGANRERLSEFERKLSEFESE